MLNALNFLGCAVTMGDKVSYENMVNGMNKE